MSILASARVAGLAVLVAEATAVVTRADGPPGLVAWTVLVALQLVAVMWATDRRSAATLRMITPALLAAVTTAAGWTTLALAVPAVASGDAGALVAIVASGSVVAALSRLGTGQRRLPLALIAAAGSALLIFLAISWVLPAVPGFVSHNHPPTYTDATRIVDPVLELALSALLAVVLGIDGLRARIRTRRVTVRRRRPAYVAGLNEMVVEPDRADGSSA